MSRDQSSSGGLVIWAVLVGTFATGNNGSQNKAKKSANEKVDCQANHWYFLSEQLSRRPIRGRKMGSPVPKSGLYSYNKELEYYLLISGKRLVVVLKEFILQSSLRATSPAPGQGLIV